MNTSLIDWGRIKHNMNQFVPVLTVHFSANAVQDKPKWYLGIICAFNLCFSFFWHNPGVKFYFVLNSQQSRPE